MTARVLFASEWRALFTQIETETLATRPSPRCQVKGARELAVGHGFVDKSRAADDLRVLQHYGSGGWGVAVVWVAYTGGWWVVLCST